MRRNKRLALIVFALVVPAAAATVGFFRSESGLAPESMRRELAGDIVRRWAADAQRLGGADAAQWEARMRPVLEKTDIANLERAASAATFEQMSAALVGRLPEPRPGPATDARGKMQAQGDVGTEALGSIDRDLVYTPLSPCRLVDTRIVGGPIAAGGTRSYRAFTATDFASQGGASSNCNIPANVSALTVKIASVLPAASGFFTAYPFNEPLPLASSLNYVQGLILSNEAHIRLCRPACTNEFNVYSFAQSDVTIDVTGYYAEPTATALDCTVATQNGNLDLLGGLQTRSLDCPVGYTATGGGCGGVLGVAISNSEPKIAGGVPVGWQCDLVGSLLSGLSYRLNAVCCRVPGR